MVLQGPTNAISHFAGLDGAGFTIPPDAPWHIDNNAVETRDSRTLLPAEPGHCLAR
jgi:hypothetical protein